MIIHWLVVGEQRLCNELHTMYKNNPTTMLIALANCDYRNIEGGGGELSLAPISLSPKWPTIQGFPDFPGFSRIIASNLCVSLSVLKWLDQFFSLSIFHIFLYSVISVKIPANQLEALIIRHVLFWLQPVVLNKNAQPCSVSFSPLLGSLMLRIHHKSETFLLEYFED